MNTMILDNELLIDLAIEASEMNPEGAEILRQGFTNRMRQVPGAVAIIATQFAGERRGLAATAWCSVCADPPAILVCVNKSASAHDFIMRTRRFSVNQLATGNEETIAIFSNKRGLQGDDRFLPDAWQTGQLGLPLLEEAVTAFECAVVGRIGFRTHSIFVGQVFHMKSADDQSDPAVLFDGVIQSIPSAPVKSNIS